MAPLPSPSPSCSSGTSAEMGSNATRLGGACVGSGQMETPTFVQERSPPQYGFPLGVTMFGLVAMVTLFFVGMAVLMYCYLRILSGFSVQHTTASTVTSTAFGSSPSASMLGTSLPQQHQHNHDQRSHSTSTHHAQDHKIITLNGLHPNNLEDHLPLDGAFIVITQPGSITPGFIGFPATSPHSIDQSSSSPTASQLELSSTCGSSTNLV